MTHRTLPLDFRCVHCSAIVNTDRITSAVSNRNHCPLCLWSRHLDLFMAGDRLSACKAPMVPLGLTIKPGRNKYRADCGELMVVHSCVDCGRLSINRIAADDDSQTLLEIYSASVYIPDATRAILLASGICLLGRENACLLRRLLLGETAAYIH